MATADRIVAATEIDRSHMLEAYAASARKIVVVPGGVNLDMFAPGRGRGYGEVDEATLRTWFARDLLGLLGQPLPDGLGDIPADAPLPEAFARAQALGLLPAGLDFAAAAGRFDVFRANLGRVERYAAGPYPGRLQLFRAAASHFTDPADPTLGWSAVAAGGVDLRELPGNHWAIVRPPTVAAVAAALGEIALPRSA